MWFFLLLITSLAGAQDPFPGSRSTPVTVQSSQGETSYYPLPSGQTITFSTPGPSVWMVETRQRLGGAAGRANGTIEVLGNGIHSIMSISLKAPADRSGRIDDLNGGTPSNPERARIVVPAGGKTVTLEAPDGSPDFLIRLFQKDSPAVMAVPLPGPSSVTETGEDEFPAESEDDLALAPTSDQLEDDEEADEPPPPRPTPAQPTSSNDGAGGPAVGGAIGLGIPARGTKAVGYIAAEGRYPVYRQLISVGGAVGWYRIGVERDISVTDALTGPSNVHAEWHTDVFPFIARAWFHLPLQLGPVLPVAGTGFGLFLAKRVDGAHTQTALGVGPELLAGVEVDMGKVGRIGSTVTWSEARVVLGNAGPDGEPVRETLANTRMNLTWMYMF